MCGILCQQTNFKSASPGTGVAESQGGTGHAGWVVVAVNLVSMIKL